MPVAARLFAAVSAASLRQTRNARDAASCINALPASDMAAAGPAVVSKVCGCSSLELEAAVWLCDVQTGALVASAG